MQPTCPFCHSEKFVTYPNLSIDHEIQQLMVYCPDKDSTGCNWTGKLKDVDKHYSEGKECEMECDKCKATVKHKLLHSHVTTECPCYCPYCDITAEREVISSEHKKCCKGPIACPNNIGVDNDPQDKFDKTNEIQNDETIIAGYPSILAELQKDTFSAESVYITMEKTDKQNDATLMDQLCNIRSYLTLAVLIIAILIALLLQSPHGLGEGQLIELHTIDNTLSISLSRNITSGMLDPRHVHVAEMKQIPEVIECNNSLFSEQNEESIIEMIHKLDETKVQVNPSQKEDDYKYKQNFSKLQQQTIQLQEMLSTTVTNRQNHFYQLNNSEFSVESLLSGEIPDQVTPFIIKMHKFTKKVCDKEEWYSNPFFAFEGGYQMCLKVFAAGYGDGEGTHVSVFLHLMKGPHDDKLEESGHWPLRGTFTIELLNQLNDSTHMVQFHHHQCIECTNRVLEGFIANAGHGIPQFISHDTLHHHSNNGYYKSDSLVFRVSYEDTEPPYQVAPVTFKVTHFSQWLKSKEVWYSGPFFAFDGGYQMHLKVYPADECEGTHVSVSLHLMKGPHDDKLEQSGHWPLRGTFIIELLNQLSESNHYSRMLQFQHNFCSQCTKRVLEGVMASSGGGYTQFISHDTLHHNNSHYRNDFLVFRVSYEDMEPPYQIAPVVFKLSKFSQWLKNKEEWYSSPFFAFEEGYQMCLKVFAAGYGDAESTHVSVYLFLMKGPHDDKLEQSGHWPLRGTFTIELLNQLNDSDHYTYKVQFHYSCSEYSKSFRSYGLQRMWLCTVHIP